MLKAQDLIAHTPWETLVDVSLTVGTGELVAVIGNQNSGKHLLGQVLSGQIEAQRGRVTVNHYQLERQPVKARSQIGYLANPLVLEPFFSGFEYLDLIAAIYHLAPAARLVRIQELIGQLDLSSEVYSQFERVKISTQQKVGLAAALIHQPSVLILDEPLQFLDYADQQRVMALIKSTQKDGAAIVLITDNLPLAEGVAERFILLNQGSIVGEGTLKQLINQTRASTHDLAGVYQTIFWP